MYVRKSNECAIETNRIQRSTHTHQVLCAPITSHPAPRLLSLEPRLLPPRPSERARLPVRGLLLLLLLLRVRLHLLEELLRRCPVLRLLRLALHKRVPHLHLHLHLRLAEGLRGEHRRALHRAKLLGGEHGRALRHGLRWDHGGTLGHRLRGDQWRALGLRGKHGRLAERRRRKRLLDAEVGGLWAEGVWTRRRVLRNIGSRC